MKKAKEINRPEENIYKYLCIDCLLTRNLRKNNITKRIQSTNTISGLAYLEYCIHNGIHESDSTDINADFLFEISIAIRYEINKQIKEAKILGSLIASSLFPNNFIDKAINQ